MELVISEEQAERVITGEDYQRLAYLWAMQRCELRAHWMAQLAWERARPEPSAPPLTGTRTPGPGATSSAAAQNSELREQGRHSNARSHLLPQNRGGSGSRPGKCLATGPAIEPAARNARTAPR